MRHDEWLLAALRQVPRRYRLPPLPADPGVARSDGVDVALAFAVEAARRAGPRDATGLPDLESLFTWSLAALIRGALRPEGGDPAFQAAVLRAQDADIEEHVRLTALADADRRVVRAAVDAIAHPGKLRSLMPGTQKEALVQLHRLAAAGSWVELRRAIGRWLAQRRREDEPWHAALTALHRSPNLERLERGTALLQLEGVQRYRVLCEQGGPLAGSEAALTKGRASARLGADAEEATVGSFRGIADLLNRCDREPFRYRAVHGLRTPRGFPGAGGRTKDEWDAAIVCGADASGPADIVLLAEVKASPAAATSDLARLLGGLRRLAQADADAVHIFPSTGGEVPIHGASLQRLRPRGHSLPPHVIYCCAAPPEPRPPLFSAASKAMLLAEPASLAFASKLMRGGTPEPWELAVVWEDLAQASRLHPVLHQYAAARCAREAMLHPDDLLAAVAAVARQD